MRFFVETYGCTMNRGESAELSSWLRGMGHQQVGGEQEADVALVNTCLVIASTERKVRRRLEGLSAQGKGLIIVGCMASVDRDRLSREFPEAVVCGTKDYRELPPMVSRAFGSTPMGTEGPIEDSPLVLPIAQGCNGACTYCITKLARGDLVSYPLPKLVNRVRESVTRGGREVLVTSQDTAAYGAGEEHRLPELLKRICDLPGDFRVRVGMMNPDSLRGIVEGVGEAYRHPKLYRFLHLPVQSGSDRIVRAMGRGYTAEEYMRMVGTLRGAVPELTVSTDVITGFPGETEDDHQATVRLLEELRPNIVNVTRFSPRPGTVAERMGSQVPGWISKERSRELTALRFRISSEINASKVGREYAVLIDERGKGNSVMARTDDYLPVVIKGELPLWKRVKVRITAAASTHLYGKLL